MTRNTCARAALFAALALGPAACESTAAPTLEVQLSGATDVVANPSYNRFNCELTLTATASATGTQSATWGLLRFRAYTLSSDSLVFDHTSPADTAQSWWKRPGIQPGGSEQLYWSSYGSVPFRGVLDQQYAVGGETRSARHEYNCQPG